MIDVRAGCAGPLPLTARLEPWQVQLCAQPALLAGWLALHGSPLNVLDPAPIGRHATELQQAAAGLGVDLGVYLARKANKALAFVDEARRLGLGVDVASERELQQTLERGVPADDIVLTAAVKPRSLLELAVSSGVTVVVDNEDELRLLEQVADRRARIAFRIAPALAGRSPSRFGLAAGEILQLVDRDMARRTRHPGSALPPRRLRSERARRRSAPEPRAGRCPERPGAPAGVHRHGRRHPDELPRRRRRVGALLARASRGAAGRGRTADLRGSRARAAGARRRARRPPERVPLPPGDDPWALARAGAARRCRRPDGRRGDHRPRPGAALRTGPCVARRLRHDRRARRVPQATPRRHVADRRRDEPHPVPLDLRRLPRRSAAAATRQRCRGQPPDRGLPRRRLLHRARAPELEAAALSPRGAGRRPRRLPEHRRAT